MTTSTDYMDRCPELRLRVDRPGLDEKELGRLRELLSAIVQHPDQTVDLTRAVERSCAEQRGWERSSLKPVLEYLLWFKPLTRDLIAAAFRGAGMKDTAGEVTWRQVNIELMSAQLA